VLLLDQPTQGVDVGAREQIFAAVRAAAARGTAVVCASADYDELAGLCDRVLVLARGDRSVRARSARRAPQGPAQVDPLAGATARRDRRGEVDVLLRFRKGAYAEVHVELRSGDELAASGDAPIADRAARVRLTAPGRIASGAYELVVTTVGADRARTVSRCPLTIR
jgi:energy-coupling factor transporter ATP-binding protein EcfA2